MPKRTGPPVFGTTSANNNNLEPPPGSPSTPNLAVPRSTSPSAFTSFFTKSARWLARSKQNTSPRSPSIEMPRPSFSSGRRPTISRPTDPRPILEVPGTKLAASQSVLDLSSPPNHEHQEMLSSSPGEDSNLRNVSRKTWSRSVDDLSSFPAPATSSTPTLQRINTTKLKVDNYRANNVSPIITTTAPSESQNPSYPFPSVSTPTSPWSPATGFQSSTSSPVIFPTPKNPPAVSGGQPTTHVRSQSHGANHPSHPKPNFNGLPSPPTPPVPRATIDQHLLRHRTSSEKENTQREKEKEKPGAGGGGFGGLGGFPFHFGNSSSKANHGSSPTDKSAPHGHMHSGSHSHDRSGSQNDAQNAVSSPKITPLTSERQSKRNSQIVQLSGFVNRFTLSSKFTSPQLSLEKGWKPYKAQLQGTKLYLYKPPADRNHEIKDLFLTGPPPQEDFLEPPESTLVEQSLSPSSSRTTVQDPEVGRRKRVYWGRTRHADLVVSEVDGLPERGSPEALIHEAVFGTSFFGGSDADDVTDQADRWKLFVAAVLLCLPSKMESHRRFENELQRYMSHLVDGGEESLKETLRERIRWIIRQYVDYQGLLDERDEVWRAVLHTAQIPDMELPDLCSPPPPLPSLTSSRSLHSPHTNLGMASPQPPTAAVLPTSYSVNALNAVPGRGAPNGAGKSKGLEGFVYTGDTFMRTEPKTVAESLRAWHQSKFPKGTLKAGDLLSSDVKSQGPSVNAGDNEAGSRMMSLFSGTDSRPHWLTRVVVRQVLEQQGGKTMTPVVSGQDRPGEGETAPVTVKASSPTYARAGVVTRWIQVGEHSRQIGDECSWQAILAGLCSMPIARLDKVWRRVDERERRYVEAWVRGDKVVDPAKKCTPWIGDASEKIGDLLESARIQGRKAGTECIAVEPMQRVVVKASKVVKEWKESCVTNNVTNAEPDPPVLARFWESCSSEETPKAPHINQYLPLSNAVEPRQKGRFAPYFWRPQSSNSSVQALIPLLFPEPLPTVTLVDRSNLLRGKKESLLGLAASGVELDEGQIRQVTQTNPKQPRAHFADQQKLRNIAESDLDETLITVFNGELILKINPDLPKSRPTSIIDTSPSIANVASGTLSASPEDGRPTRGNSIRLSPAARLDRKGSMARTSRRSSLPSISQRSSLLVPEPLSTEPPVRVSVKSGTLECLVDILVSGLDGVRVSVADDNGEMPLREGRTRPIKIDRNEYARVWWAVFRSFVSPFVLFELLRKLYGSASARSKASEGSHHVAFQTGTAHAALPTNSNDSTQTRLDILSTISEWFRIGGGSQDVLDDPELHSAMKAFLSSEDKRANVVDEVETAKKNMFSLFVTQTSRPTLDSSASNDHAGRQPRSWGAKPPSLDSISPEDLVDNLDAMACTIFRGVTEAHMFELADMLEAQTADKTGWFLSRDLPTGADDIAIQNIYSHLLVVEPSPLVAEITHHDTLNKLLSPSLRSLLRAHATMRDWLISKITTPGIGLVGRQTRMELLLDAIEICRSRTLYNEPQPQGTADIHQPTIRSFVESALFAAILSPESRAFTRAWQGLASSRNGNLDEPANMILGTSTQNTASQKRLTVDAGWVVERMLEVITLPDTMEAGDGHNLVNLDKRRYLYNLVVNAAGLIPRTKRASETERADMERLNHMAREVLHNPLDVRACRDEAYRELMSSPPQASSKKQVRPFHLLVAAQMEKVKRDKYLRDRLNKEKKMEQQRSDKRASAMNRAMQPQKPTQLGQKHARNKKSMTSMAAFFRPLSTAFSSSTLHSTDAPRRTVAELDFTTEALKPHLVLNLVGAGIRNFINDQRPFTFQLDTEEGGHYLLQAVGATDRDKWMAVMGKVAETSALKRLTFLGQSKGKLPDMADYSQNTPADPSGIFGHDLLSVLCKESLTGEYVAGSLPRVVELCLGEIEKRGLTEVGMYRIAGSRTTCNALRAELNSGRTVDLSMQGDYADIHVIGDVLRQWLRELPESVFTQKLYENFVDAMKIPDYEDRNAMLRLLLWQLPRQNFDLIKRLFEHLDSVTDYESENQMSADALAICFNLTLFRPSNMANLGGMQFTLSLVKTCITHFHWLFSETENDADAHDDSGSDTASGPHSQDEVAEQDEYPEDQDDTFTSSFPPQP